jgi:hypothetical protein
MILRSAVASAIFCPLGEVGLAFEPLGGIETPYTQKMNDRLQAKENPHRNQGETVADERGIRFVCFRDAKDEYYIGAAQFQTIAARIDVVAKILGEFDRYVEWTEGLVKSKTEKISPNRFLVALEQEIPVPLVSNIHTQLLYEVDTTKDRVTFRYQLKKSDSLVAYDGIIILESAPNNSTVFSEYDILNADWGVAKALGVKKIWSDSLKAMYQADLAVKFQAETPDMPLKKVMKSSVEAASKKDFRSCYDQRQPL